MVTVDLGALYSNLAKFPWYITRTNIGITIGN
jgi:hypothetical protein